MGRSGPSTIYVSIDLFIYPSTYLSVYLSTYLPICLSTCLPVYLSTYLPTYLSIFLSLLRACFSDATSLLINSECLQYFLFSFLLKSMLSFCVLLKSLLSLYFPLKSLLPLHLSTEIPTFPSLFYWNPYYLCTCVLNFLLSLHFPLNSLHFLTFPLKSLPSLHFSIEILTFSVLFCWNLSFPSTFLMKFLLSLHFSVVISRKHVGNQIQKNPQPKKYIPQIILNLNPFHLAQHMEYLGYPIGKTHTNKTCGFWCLFANPYYPLA